MIYDIEKGNYDFLHGAVGNGTYFLNRLNKKESKDYLKELIDHLDKISHKKGGDKIAWESVLDHEKGTKGYNLSLSHGISSIIAFLAKMLEKEIYIEKVSSLLNGAINYLLSHALDTEKYSSNFPSWISDDYPAGSSRLAWCYGDLGIGIALWQAARAAGNKEWEQKAFDVLLHTTNRRDLKENAVIDAGLCHGAAGIAHIYNRMYHYTGRNIFRESTLYWLDHTLKMAVYTDGCAGYKAWHTEKYGGWVAESGLLEGVAGIGLMLVSIVSDIEPKWDRCLFLS
jgi:lantibiotic modifying enzyme